MISNRFFLPDGKLFYFSENQPQFSFSGAYTLPEIKLFFKSLRASLALCQNSVILIFRNSTNQYIDNAFVHFNREENNWELMNQNRFVTVYADEDESIERLALDFHSLLSESTSTESPQNTASSSILSNTSSTPSSTSHSDYLMFSTKILRPHLQQNEADFFYSAIENWQSSPSWNRIHEVTSEKAKAISCVAGITWLHLAVRISKLEIVQALLEKEADPNALTKEGHAPLHLIFSNSKSDKKIVNVLLNFNADPHLKIPVYEATPFHVAVSRGNRDIALCLHNKADTVQPLPKIIFKGIWLTRLALSLGISSLVSGNCSGYGNMGGLAMLSDELTVFDDRIWELYKFFISALLNGELYNLDGTTPILLLHQLTQPLPKDTVAFLGAVEFIQHLHQLSHYHEKNAVVPLHSQFLNFILPKKLEDERDEQDEKGSVVRLENFSGVYSLKELSDYFFELQNAVLESNLMNPFYFSFGSGVHEITFTYQRQHKQSRIVNNHAVPSVSIQNMDETAKTIHAGMHLSKQSHRFILLSTAVFCSKKYESVTKNCLKKWKNTAALQNMHRMTPEKISFINEFNYNWMMIAVTERQHEIVRQLVLNGAHKIKLISGYGSSFITAAASRDDASIIKFIFDHLTPEEINFYQHPPNRFGIPLQSACGNNGLKSARLLLAEYKADPNYLDMNNTSALLISCSKGHAEMVQLLIDHRANLMQKNNDGWTALTAALCFGRADSACIKILLRYIDDLQAIQEASTLAKNLLKGEIPQEIEGKIPSRVDHTKDKELMIINELLDLRLQLESLCQQSSSSFSFYNFFTTQEELEHESKIATKLKLIIYKNTSVALDFDEQNETQALKSVLQQCKKWYPEKFAVKQPALKKVEPQY